MDNDESKPFAERMTEYLRSDPHGRIRSVNDDEALAMVAEEYCTPQEPEPKVVIKPVVPFGYVPADSDVLEYQKLRQDPNLDLVRERMLETLSPEDRELADSEHAHFNWHYKATSEHIRQQVEDRLAREKEVLDKVERSKEYYRARMMSSDPCVKQKAEVDFLLKHVNVKL